MRSRSRSLHSAANNDDFSQLIAFEITIVLLREGFAIRDERAAERKEKEKEAAAAHAVAI